LLAVVELVLAGLVFSSGGRVLPDILLIFWSALLVHFGLRYRHYRRSWTRERIAASGRLLEAMLGHRTKLAQQPVEYWYASEDLAVADYIQRGRVMDASGAWLTAFVPRAWLTTAVVALIPGIVSHAPSGEIAIAVGGILLAYRSLRRLSSGLSMLAGAAIASKSIRPVIEAAARRERAPDPSRVIRNSSASGPDGLVMQACDLSYAYPGQPHPVLQECTLLVARGSRLLLEGASGTGKSTLACLLSGLRTPQSGLLLVDGLDRSVLGRTGWRRRVVMAPQPHDNYLLGGSLAFNLLMGCRWPPQPADLVEAERICRELGLGDLLDRMPGGLHQFVGETGWQLSQGERTRIFLARALLKKPDVLILDESFGALDPENIDRASRCVQRRAETIIAIAHT
jgi:ATP-binding cassette subfamily B protein